MDNVSLMDSFSLLFPGLIAEDTISPEQDEVSGTEGESVTLRCNYQTSSDYADLYWYKHHSDLQAPQFILWKRGKGGSIQYIPDNRYGSQTTKPSVPLKIQKLQLSDSAVYYCVLRPTVTGNMEEHYSSDVCPTLITPKTCCFTSFCFHLTS
uniref:T-cell receptor alpha/delta variable 22.0 n=1 Tax=Amphiprion percula TaxID=161767 RepID=A0A3P8SNP7_AMPPE